MKDQKFVPALSRNQALSEYSSFKEDSAYKIHNMGDFRNEFLTKDGIYTDNQGNCRCNQFKL